MSKNKDTYYFSHDSNARNDEKILAIRMRHKAEGYGVYFMILERLRECTDFMSVKDYNVLAFDFRVSADIVKSIVEDFGLFVFTEDGKHFYSERMQQSMVIVKEKSEQARLNAQKRWSKQTENQVVNANAMQTQCKRNAIKEKKSKEYKEKDISKDISKKKVSFCKPTLEEVKNFIAEKSYNVDAEKFWNFYESKDWFIGKNKMKDWKASVRTWVRSEVSSRGQPQKKVNTDVDPNAEWIGKTEKENPEQEWDF